jgi:anaphase-promoting complex subunit 10
MSCLARCSQVAVLANHQNGRDTHIRQVLLFGPSQSSGSASSQQQLDTMESSMFRGLR